MNRQQITELVNNTRLPAIYAWRDYVEAGGLISYASDLTDTFRRMAGKVIEILNGANPADVPIEHATEIPACSQSEDRERNQFHLAAIAARPRGGGYRMMRRRDPITAARPLRARQKAIPVVGYLSTGTLSQTAWQAA